MKKKQSQQEEYFSLWGEHMEFELSDLGMYHLWLYKGNGFTTQYIKNSVKLRLNDMFQQGWHEDVFSHEFCDFYKLIKNEWGKMKYLSNLCYYQRKLLSKWRCRSNYLPISSSRFVISDAILCPLCKGENLGDEMHYLLDCPFFDEDRMMYLGNCFESYIENEEVEPVLNLFKTENPENIHNLIKFINIVMTVFDNKKEWDRDIVIEPSIFYEDEDI